MIGIIVVLLIGRALNAPAEIPVTPSATRFSYVYLGTEPVITTPLIEETEVEFTEPPVVEPEEPTEAPATPTRSTPPTLIILGSPTNHPQGTTPTPTLTSTSASGPPLNPGTYDNVDSHLVYSGSWAGTTVPGAYQNTLHVSLNPGPPASTISFRFIGRQLRLVYQGGSTLGQVRISIDNGVVNTTVDQSSGTEWASDLLPNSTHSVLITHLGGGSVNLDQVIIPEPSNTPTPTPTATQNS